MQVQRKKSVRFLNATGQSLITATVPKNRKPKFELALKIIDLNNVPLVTGTSYVKWHLPHSTAAEDRGKTSKAAIKDHKVTWDYEKALQLRMTVDRNGVLQDTEIHFEIMQEYASGARGGRITLGHLRLNLAEYVDVSDDTGESVVRRYLMAESKINSTLKVSVFMKLLEGDRNFTAPQLRTAPIFGGIAGIMTTAEKGETEEGHIPAMSSKITRDIGEMQDMYRRTLTASYASQIRELPADECIEDIFAGGDGFGSKIGKVEFQNPFDSADENGSDGGHLVPPSKNRRYSHGPKSAQTAPNKSPRSSPRIGHGRNSSGPTAKRNGDGQSTSSSDEHKHPTPRKANEVSEFDVRENLRSWSISPHYGQ